MVLRGRRQSLPIRSPHTYDQKSTKVFWPEEEKKRAPSIVQLLAKDQGKLPRTLKEDLRLIAPSKMQLSEMMLSDEQQSSKKETKRKNSQL